MSQSLVEEPQIQRSLTCSRDLFPKKLPLTSGFKKKNKKKRKNRRSTRKWLHNAGLMRSDRGFGGLRFNTISTHKSEETNETHLYSTSRLQWEPWALGAAQREVSSVSYSFTSALCPSDSACFRNINLLYFTPKLCIMCALCTQLERRLSPYQVLLRFMTRKFRASSKLSCFSKRSGCFQSYRPVLKQQHRPANVFPVLLSQK